MSWDRVRRRLPRPLVRYLWYFETGIEDAVEAFAREMPPRARVLDAGAGEGRYRHRFPHARYTGVDLAVGDATWDYSSVDALADLEALPFRDNTFDGCLNIVTLEHVREPKRVLAEIARTLVPGGRLLLVAPLEWEVHQAPHDYYRYTCHGLEYLLGQAGLRPLYIAPRGGIFRLLSRRLLNALGCFRGAAFVLAALFFAPPALLLPLLDPLDRTRRSTLGYFCAAIKP